MNATTRLKSSMKRFDNFKWCSTRPSQSLFTAGFLFLSFLFIFVQRKRSLDPITNLLICKHMKEGKKKNPALSDFLMTLAATTVSIVLTFGTTAIVDHKKKSNAKREMVLMVMYDMRESLTEMEECDSEIREFFDTQVEAVAHPKEFEEYYGQLAVHIPILSYTTTTETIFRSNVETIQTIGNILFVETVSSFYDLRERYNREVAGVFAEQAQKAIGGYGSLYVFEADLYPFTSSAYIRNMKEALEQCKLMMKVTDKDLDVFSIQQKKIREAAKGKDTYDTNAAIDERLQRRYRMQQAREEGRKELQ